MVKYYKKIDGKQYLILVSDLNKGVAETIATKHRQHGRYKNVRVVSIAGRWGICVR